MAKHYTIYTLPEYLKVLNSISIDYQLSRGQAFDKPLLPSALRCDDDSKKLYSKATIKSFLDDFQANAFQYIGNSLPNDYYEWMVYAQHFGVPTQLLDFTYSHIISLMFAVEHAFDYDEEDQDNAVVWFLNPLKLNEKTVRRSEIVNIINAQEVLRDAEYPVTISTPKNNNRINAQNGVFVYFPYESAPLEQVAPSEDTLIKVLIPHSNCKQVLSSLYRLRLRFSNLYPELSSVSKDILLKTKVLEFLRETEQADIAEQTVEEG